MSALALTLAGSPSVPTAASAGGLQLATRGVRPTARGGAFVAGADGLGAFGFNPAGIAALVGGDSERAFLVDFGFVRQSASYARVDSGGTPQREVSNQAPGLPIPTLGVALDWGKRFTLAIGVFSPYAALGKYDEDGPQRYSLVDMSRSLLSITEIAIGYRASDSLRLGIGLQNMFVALDATVAFSSCPSQIFCAPEDPEFDAVGRVSQISFINPSAVVGVQKDFGDAITVGAAVQLPFYVSGRGSIQTRLPSSGFFDGAQVVGDRADVSFTLPAAFRVGVQVAPIPRWTVEVAASAETWSQHERFLIEPQDVRIEDAAGVGTYEIGPLNIARNFENTLAVNVGVEGQPLADVPVTALAGYSFETAAAPDEFVTVMTVDGDRHLAALGAGYQRGRLAFHATLGYVFVSDRQVAPEVGRSPQLNPIRDDTDEPLEVFVNWGTYRSSWLIAGAGVSGSF